MEERICAYCNNEVFVDGGGDDMTLVDGEWYHTFFCVPPKPKKYTCARCGKDNLYRMSGGQMEMDNVLMVQLQGWYGMFIDYLSREEEAGYRFALCHECAHEVCEQNPWLNKIIEPFRTHSHTTEYHEANPDHLGWDYDTHFMCDWCKEVRDFGFLCNQEVFEERVCTDCWADSKYGS